MTWDRGPLHLWRVCILPCEWVAWSGKLGEPLRKNTLTFRSVSVLAKGGRVHSFGGLLLGGGFFL